MKRKKKDEIKKIYFNSAYFHRTIQGIVLKTRLVSKVKKKKFDFSYCNAPKNRLSSGGYQ